MATGQNNKNKNNNNNSGNSCNYYPTSEMAEMMHIALELDDFKELPRYKFDDLPPGDEQGLLVPWR
jgi:hypothetical protein